MRLSDLKTGQSATILKILGHGGFRRRIMEMGFVRGKKVEVVLNAPLRDPIVYKIMDYEVSLRRSEAHMVVVITNEEAEGLISEEYNGTFRAVTNTSATTAASRWTPNGDTAPTEAIVSKSPTCRAPTHSRLTRPRNFTYAAIWRNIRRT